MNHNEELTDTIKSVVVGAIAGYAIGSIASRVYVHVSHKRYMKKAQKRVDAMYTLELLKQLAENYRANEEAFWSIVTPEIEN